MKYLILSGVHGNEQCAVLAAHKAIAGIENENHSGIVIDHTIVNVPALKACCREIPDEEEPTNDMNRMYGLRPVFSRDNVIANIKRKISEVDVLIDVHNSPSCCNSILISNNKYARDYVKFAENNGIRYIVRESAVPTAKKYAIEHGKIGITVELGGMLYTPCFEKIMESQVSFLHKLVMSLEVYEQLGGTFGNGIEPLPVTANMVSIYSHNRGIVDYKVPLGQRVSAGDVLAEISTVEAGFKVVETVTAPYDGWIADVCQQLYVDEGDSIGDFQREVRP